MRRGAQVFQDFLGFPGLFQGGEVQPYCVTEHGLPPILPATSGLALLAPTSSNGSSRLSMLMTVCCNPKFWCIW
jgi:hypothetical protein